jgi:SAM-dependent methyltransferase
MTTPEQVKACCADAYGSDLAALLLGDSYHPGGLALTRRLATVLGLQGGECVLDVAAGRGTTAVMLAREYGTRVDGLDLSPANVALGQGAAAGAELGDRVAFSVGDAEQLPYPDYSFDAIVCECAFCTFPDKAAAAAQFARVLRPNGRLGITDVVAEPDRLPRELTTIIGRIACIADARPLDGYVDLLAGAGLRVTRSERHDSAMGRMIDQIEARLTVVRLTARAQAEALGLQFSQAEPVLAAARQALADGVIGYALLIAEPA